MSGAQLLLFERIEHVVGVLFLAGLAYQAGLAKSRIDQLESECERHSVYIRSEQESLPVLAEQVRALGARMATIETTLAESIRQR